ncbi:MAG: DUF2029 domain-containing protein [Chitinophagaceae bacterium]|nr:DUF2029 domain-containing protein [Chitinophagaceae bacterium]
MNWKDTRSWILSGKFLYDKNLAIVLWFGLSFIAVLQDVIGNHINNYIIFKHVYLHTIQQTNLYLEYPSEYLDVNLYGPVFSVLIAPFTYLPDKIATIAWELFNVLALFIAIKKLPIVDKWKNAIIILSSHEMMNTASWLQSNALIAACIIFGFLYIHRGKDYLALFFILLATFIKLYGIVGFAFFFFSKNKLKFIGWTLLWSAVFFVLPLLITSKTFLVQSYYDWLEGLQYKAVKNVNPNDNYDYQDICVMGMIRRIFNIPYLKNYYITIPAVIIFGLQYLRYDYFKNTSYRLYLLCSVLITTVIFTTSAESPTYIIAFPAACIWYVMQEHTKATNAFFIFVLLLTSFSYSDIFTPYLRENIIRPYSLKALPCFILWIVLVKQIFSKQFLNIPADRILLTQ